MTANTSQAQRNACFSEYCPSECLPKVPHPLSPTSPGLDHSPSPAQGETLATVIYTSAFLASQVPQSTRRQLEGDLCSGEICSSSWPNHKAQDPQTTAPRGNPARLLSGTPTPIYPLGRPSESFFHGIRDLQHKLYSGQRPPSPLSRRHGRRAQQCPDPRAQVRSRSAGRRCPDSPAQTWLSCTPDGAALCPPLLSSWMQRDAWTRSFHCH